MYRAAAIAMIGMLWPNPHPQPPPRTALHLVRQLHCTKYRRDHPADVGAKATYDCHSHAGHLVVSTYADRAHLRMWRAAFAPAAPYAKGRVVQGRLWTVVTPGPRQSRMVMRLIGGHLAHWS